MPGGLQQREAARPLDGCRPIGRGHPHRHPRHAQAQPRAGGEEWAIHDYEGFCGLHLGEYEDIEEVAVLASVIEKHGEAIARYINNRGRDYVNLGTLEEDFEDAFVGQYESPRDFAETSVEELGFGGLTPEQLEGIWGFLDWDHVAHELTITDYWCADARELG